jgi:hypothetical protein
VILRSNGSLGEANPPNALRAKGVEEEDESMTFRKLAEDVLGTAYEISVHSAEGN